MLKSKVFHKHVNVSGIVLITVPFLPQSNLFNVLMLSDDP